MDIEEIPELIGKTIERVEVYSDIILVTFKDGETAAAIYDTADGLRVNVERRSGGLPVSVGVFPAHFPYPGKLPEAALRRDRT